jgi:phage protein D
MSEPRRTQPGELLSHFYLRFGEGGRFVEAEAPLMRAVISIAVENSLHLPDVATMEIHDPQLKWVDSEKLAPGRAVRITARATEKKSDEKTVFDGEIVEIESEFGASSHQLIVRAFDRLHRLTRGRHVRSFRNVTDADVVKRLAREARLEADVAATRRVHGHLFQNNQTNLEFLRDRARALGFLLYVQGRKLCFKPPSRHKERAIELQWGAELSEFRARLTTIGQIDKVVVRGWDPQSRREITGQSGKGEGARDIGHQKQGGAMAREAFQIEAEHLVANQPVRSQAEADHIAQAVADRQAERFIEAEGACRGNPGIVAGATLKLSALGQRFSGAYFVTAATHHFNAERGYATRFSISGQTPATLLRLLRGDDDERAMNGFGLLIGIVTDNRDPDGWARVKVKFPYLTGDYATDWARVASAGAGRQRGIQFIPEVNDEVLVGFEFGDVHHPYVIGGLWNGKDAPPDKQGAGKLVIADQYGNSIRLDSEGVTIKGKTINLN